MRTGHSEENSQTSCRSVKGRRMHGWGITSDAAMQIDGITAGTHVLLFEMLSICATSLIRSSEIIDLAMSVICSLCALWAPPNMRMLPLLQDHGQQNENK